MLYQKIAAMLHSPGLYDGGSSHLFSESYNVVQNMLRNIEALLLNPYYTKEDAEHVDGMIENMRHTIQHAQHNDDSFTQSYENLQLETDQHVQKMLDDNEYTQCTLSTQRILDTMKCVMLTEPFNMDSVRKLWKQVNITWRDASLRVSSDQQQRFQVSAQESTMKCKAMLDKKKETENALTQIREGVSSVSKFHEIRNHIASVLTPEGHQEMDDFSHQLHDAFENSVRSHKATLEEEFGQLAL